MPSDTGSISITHPTKQNKNIHLHTNAILSTYRGSVFIKISLNYLMKYKIDDKIKKGQPSM